jgi:glycosyltransferase involved in cell wall biosynthesis
MKVGILATAREKNGGTLLYTLSMISALSRLPSHRYQFVIFTQTDNHEYDALGLPVEPLPNLWSVLVTRLIGRDYFVGADKMISPVYSMTLLVCGCPYAFTLHDLQEKYYPENFSRLTRIWRSLSNRLLTRKAASIICESMFVQRDIVKFFGVPENKIAVVPAPPIAMLCESANDESDALVVRQKFDLPLQYIFYPAQFWPHKNHLRLIEAFGMVCQQYPDSCLVLTGKKRDEYERIFALVHKLGLQSRVRHIGYVEQAELAALYRGATMVTVPTLFESISIPVYEAFSMRTAVCASNVVALPEQIGDAGILFDPLSVDDMAEKMIKLWSDPQLRHSLIERGSRRMASVTHEQYAQSLAKILEGMG